MPVPASSAVETLPCAGRVRRRTALASVVLASALGCAMAQDSPRFRISGFELTGDIPLSTQETTRILAPYISSQASIETLQQASAALEAELKAQGHVLHRVSLPPQEVGDKVALVVVKFVIGRIEVEGARHFSAENIRASLPELQSGQAPNFRRLALQTAIANENPSKKVQVGMRESDEQDRIDVRLQVADEAPWSVVLGASNTGSDATGNDRISLVAGHNNLWGRDHQASLAYTSSAERGEGVKQYGLNYRAPWYGGGGVAFASYTNSDVVGHFGAFSSSGAGQTAGVGYSHYFEPQGGTRSYLTLSLDDKTFRVSKLNGVAIPGQQERNSRPLTLSYARKTDMDGMSYGYSLGWARNLPSEASAASLAAYRSEDTRVTTTEWSAWRADFNMAAGLGGGWLFGAKGQLQYSTDALLSGEQFGLGGSASVRGTSERAISGDSGLLWSLELSTPELLPGLRLLGFMDAGLLQSNNTAGSSSKVARDTLSSVGLGLRYGAGAIGLSAEYARLLQGATPPDTVPAGLPRKGDDKLHINVTARF
ncbi:MAG: ShlB/FhaC/HecB family hemolysin secretion/activation protein [Rhodoferax sp.]